MRLQIRMKMKGMEEREFIIVDERFKH